MLFWTLVYVDTKLIPSFAKPDPSIYSMLFAKKQHEEKPPLVQQALSGSKALSPFGLSAAKVELVGPKVLLRTNNLNPVKTNSIAHVNELLDKRTANQSLLNMATTYISNLLGNNISNGSKLLASHKTSSLSAPKKSIEADPLGKSLIKAEPSNKSELTSHKTVNMTSFGNLLRPHKVVEANKESGVTGNKLMAKKTLVQKLLEKVGKSNLDQNLNEEKTSKGFGFTLPTFD